MMSCFGFGKSQVKEPLLPFTTYILKVDSAGGWESTLAKVFKKTKVVANFRMHGDELCISGIMNPIFLLKVLGKSGKAVTLVGWQFGGCSRNLQMPEFEYKQYYKQNLEYHRYLAELQAAYENDIYNHMHGGGHGRGRYADNYGDATYGTSNYSHPPQQYLLPSGHHHPNTQPPYDPTYGAYRGY